MSSLFEKHSDNVIQLYKKKSIIPVKGKGCYITAKNGKKYLDLIGGIAVNLLGYNDKFLNKVISKQMKKYIHISNYFLNPKETEAASLLKENYIKDSKIAFTNSGTESMELVLKIIYKYMKLKGKTKIIAFSDSFHGRTTGSLSVTGIDLHQKYFTMNREYIKFVLFNSMEELEKNIDSKTGAVISEMILGGGGVVEADDAFIKRIRELTGKYNAIFAVDEIQTGLGRTGSFFAYQKYDIIPDLIAVSKGLGGGFPLGAVLAKNEIADLLKRGEHGSTFAPNPVSLAAAVHILKEIKSKNYTYKNLEKGQFLLSKLENIQKNYPNFIKDIRGRGLMIGIELNTNIAELEKFLLSKGIIVHFVKGNVLRLLPSYIIKKNDLSYFVNSLIEFIEG